jgi:choline dehydrogenase-like flavoprotein
MYIAGASLFPTAGTANPTLTIAALSLRTADHLKTELGFA